MICQNCKRRIPDIAESCRCGWTKESAREAGFVHCANETCPACAVARVKTPTGYANFCPQHYEDYFTKQAEIFCGSRALDTVEKQHKFCRETISQMRMRIAA